MLSCMLAVAAAASLSLISSVNGCTCGTIPSLFDCEVPEGYAALLVTTNCVKQVSCINRRYAAVADTVIDKVFKDNTVLGLSAGDMVTVRSRGRGSCIGPAFAPGMQMVILAPNIHRSVEDDDDEDDDDEDDDEEIDEESLYYRILRSKRIDDSFSDGSMCEVSDADFDVGSCSPGVTEPTQAQINQLIHSCSTMTTGVPPDLANQTPA